MSSAEHTSNKEDIYTLPHDQPEFQRLNGQHIAFKFIYGGTGLYPYKEVVQGVLQPADGESKRVLDLGSGSGIWCVEMAREFPHVQVIGIDLEPKKVEEVPLNCKFITGDFTEPLLQFHAHFDFIHWRFGDIGVKDYHKTMVEVQRCLKPGGLLIVITATKLLTENRIEYYPPWTTNNPQGSWLQRFVTFTRLGGGLAGSDIKGIEDVCSKGLWSDKICDPVTCGASFIKIPLGTWTTSSDSDRETRLQRLGGMWRDSLARVHHHHGKSLTKCGRTLGDINVLHQKIDEELAAGGKHQYLLVRTLWGRAPGDSNEAPLPKSILFSDMEEAREDEPQMIFTYHDEEAWASANRSLASTLTPDTISLETVLGFDIIEM